MKPTKAKKSSKKGKGKAKGLTLKCTKVSKDTKPHYFGNLYHIEEDQLQGLRGAKTELYDKNGERVKQPWEIFPQSKK